MRRNSTRRASPQWCASPPRRRIRQEARPRRRNSRIGLDGQPTADVNAKEERLAMSNGREDSPRAADFGALSGDPAKPHRRTLAGWEDRRRRTVLDARNGLLE